MGTNKMVTTPPLYELVSPGSLKPLRRYLFFIRHLIALIQENILSFALPAKHIVRKKLADKGAATYIFKVTDKSYIGPKKFFTDFETALREAEDVWMCVGEMGFRLMERDEIIDGINFAAKKNGATIRIIHGPRTDPNTKRIFDLAKNGKVELYELPKYTSNHFMYLVSKTGETLLIDESPHLEPVRAQNQEGKVVEFYRSQHRFFYFIKNPNWLGYRRLKQAQKRISRAIQHQARKVSLEPRGYPLVSILLNYVLFLIPYSLVLQPLLVYLDRISLPWRNVYTREGTSSQKISIRGMEKMREHDSSMQKSRKHEEEFGMKFEKVVVLGGFTSGSIILSGVVLESFLRIPITNYSTHVPVAIASGIVGAAIGGYLNNKQSK